MVFNALRSFLGGIGDATRLGPQQTCPFCFDRFKMVETPFRCVGANCSFFDRDEQRASVWGENAPMKRVIPPDGRYRSSARCTECKRESMKRLCPHCHMELPSEFGRYPMMIFAMIGAKGTGKSHYLAVLLEQIKKNIGPALDVLLTPLNDDTSKRFEEQFRRQIYDRKDIIPETESAGLERAVKRPLAFSMTFSSRDRRGRPVPERVIYLSFFDTAGEDMMSLDRMETHHRYIVHADGLIMLFDPTQLAAVRAKLPEVADPGVDPDPVAMLSIVERTNEVIRTARRIATTTLLDVPIAVAFSKFDAVEPLIDPGLGVLSSPRHQNGFNLSDHQQVDAEVQALLHEWDCHDLVQSVQTRFRYHAFFGLSALGCHPARTKSIPSINPRRVEDPLLWLLHHHKYIKTSS